MDCPYCGRGMSKREIEEQHCCNDCYSPDYHRDTLNPDQAFCEYEPDEWEE